jgi:polyvinyl alcohol dehydrogenase (cytochrome)
MRKVLLVACLALVCVIAAPLHAEEAKTDGGEALFRERCAACHDGAVARAPGIAALRQMSVDNIRSVLTTGSMKEQAQDLTTAQVDMLSQFLGEKKATAVAAPELRCAKVDDAQVDLATGPHWNGWGVDLSQHRFQSAAEAQLTADDVPRLKLKWAFGFPGANRAYAQPTIMGGRLFVGSATGKVYSLDAKSGCIHWIFDAGAPVRTAISIGKSANNWSAYFGDQRANAYSVDALSGKLLWKTHADEHGAAIITGAPTLAAGVLYVPLSSQEELFASSPLYPCCSFRGSVAALDVVSGQILWKNYTIPKAAEPVRKNEYGFELLGPSGAGIWSAPTIDLQKRMIYVTTGDSYSDPAANTSDAFVAFHLENGAMAWWYQATAGDAYTVACIEAAAGQNNCPQANGPDLDFGSSPILVDLANGRRALIAGQKSGIVHAIDPDRDGAVLWQVRVGEGGRLGGVQWGAAADEHNVYVAVSDVKVRVAPSGTPGAQPGIIAETSYLLDPNAGGGLYALKLETGELVWHAPHPGCGDQPGCSRAQSAAVTAIPGVVFSGGLDGHLRAYAATTGSIIWDVDTKGEYHTLNGLVAHGGSIDGPGAVVVGGMLYVNSGYQFFGTIPGNVLLAFSVKGD